MARRSRCRRWRRSRCRRESGNSGGRRRHGGVVGTVPRSGRLPARFGVVTVAPGCGRARTRQVRDLSPARVGAGLSRRADRTGHGRAILGRHTYFRTPA
jgi:hypothetical protein